MSLKPVNYITLNLCLLLLFSPSVYAQKHQHYRQTKTKEKEFFEYVQPIQKTEGHVGVEGEPIKYTALAGTLPILAENEKDTTARMSFFAYVRKSKKDRPITFFFNGGPGASTYILHMAGFGPKHVRLDSTKRLGSAPYALVNNQYSLLDATDLVFVDAPQTGFGRIKPHHEGDFFGVDEDARAFGQFISRYLTKYDRWNSPKFIYGESYGTTRAAALSSILQDDFRVNLNGVILQSEVLNWELHAILPAEGNDAPYPLHLPTYAATAWYHNKLPKSHDNLKTFLKEVEEFASTDYAVALRQGNSLSPEKFDEIAKQLYQYTGLPINYIKKANLRIDEGQFEHKLLSEQDKVLARFDTRYEGDAIDPLAQRPLYGPGPIGNGHVALFNKYVRNDLNYGENMDYHFGISILSQWDWTHKNRVPAEAVNVMPYLSRAMIKNPDMGVMFNNGRYDLSTPYFEGIYELEHLNIPSSFQKNIEMHFYQSGHMIYVNKITLNQLHKNVKDFIKENS